MQRVLGIGGVFFKARGDQAALLAWYRDHLGIDFAEEWGGKVFQTGGPDLTWSIFPSDTTYFSPGSATFMINYEVADLAAMLAQLREAGVTVSEKTDESEFGKFGWAVDPEGNRIELWQRP